MFNSVTLHLFIAFSECRSACDLKNMETSRRSLLCLIHASSVIGNFQDSNARRHAFAFATSSAHVGFAVKLASGHTPPDVLKSLFLIWIHTVSSAPTSSGQIICQASIPLPTHPPILLPDLAVQTSALLSRVWNWIPARE